MAAKAGDTVYELGAVRITPDGTSTIEVRHGMVGRDGYADMRVRFVQITLTAPQAAQASTLRAAIVASLTASPPEFIVGGKETQPVSREQKRANRLERLRAERL